jgi:hypothetical protein
MLFLRSRHTAFIHHARLYAGHPCLEPWQESKGVDGRDKPGHDEVKKRVVLRNHSANFRPQPPQQHRNPHGDIERDDECANHECAEFSNGEGGLEIKEIDRMQPPYPACDYRKERECRDENHPAVFRFCAGLRHQETA